MKFNYGHWVKKEGVKCFSPAEVYFHKIHNRELVICAPTMKITGRGQTLEGVNLTITVSNPLPEVFRIKVQHNRGVVKRVPQFELRFSEEEEINFRETDDELILVSGSFSLIIEKKTCNMYFCRDGEVITKSIGGDITYAVEDFRGFPYEHYDENRSYMRGQLSLSLDETIYGLGERFTPYVKNGQTVDIWNEDGGTSSELSYKNIPFYMSSRGYGVFVNNTGKVSFEAGSEFVSKVGFSVEGEEIDYFVINGPDPKNVLTRYTDLTGKPGLPAPWSFGLWLTTSFTTDYDEKTVMGFIDGMKEHDIPLRVFHFDCFWMREFSWCDFTWDERVFPDPKGMLARIKEKGINICVWINPYIGQESSLFDEGMNSGYFLKRPNGDVWQWDMWQPGMALVDFTNPDACKWYASKLEMLLDMGVDCFKTDFGERIPTDAVYFDGSDPQKMHNYYTYLYNRLVYDVLVKKRGRSDAVLFARSATAGSQKFPVHWGGDCFSDYDSMAQSLRGGLSLTMSGFGFWSHDIGGFESTSTPDVYKRWAAFGLLSTHSRLHGSSSYRVPWLYDDEAVEVVRKFTKLKYRLMPYLYAYAIETAMTGIPMMRSMFLEFPEDLNCRFLDKQYMLGAKLLIAPILNNKGTGSFYLPDGTWTELLTGETLQGGRWYEKHYDYMHIPLFVRENSIIVYGAHEDRPDYDYTEDAIVNVYEIPEYGNTATMVFGMEGREGLKIQIKSEEVMEIRITGNTPQRIVFINAKDRFSTDCAEEYITECATKCQVMCVADDIVITPQKGAQKICLKKL